MGIAYLGGTDRPVQIDETLASLKEALAIFHGVPVDTGTRVAIAAKELVPDIDLETREIFRVVVSGAGEGFTNPSHTLAEVVAAGLAALSA